MSTPAQVIWDAEPAPAQAAPQVAWDEPKKPKLKAGSYQARPGGPVLNANEPASRELIHATERGLGINPESIEQAPSTLSAVGTGFKEMGKTAWDAIARETRGYFDRYPIASRPEMGLVYPFHMMARGAEGLASAAEESAKDVEAGIKNRDLRSVAAGAGTALGARGQMEVAQRGGEALPGAARAAAQIVRVPSRLIAETTKGVARQLTAPEAAKAMRQAIQPGVNIPRAGESIEIAGPRMKQVMEDQGIELRRTGEKGGVTGKTLEVVREAKRQVHEGIEQRLGPVEQLAPETTVVADAMERTISGRTERQFPEVAKRIRARAETYRGNLSLREIEDSIQDANNDLRELYKRPSQTDSKVSADIQATQAEAKALRTLLDQKVQELSGAGVKDLKREYGALRDVERALARQHAVQTRVKGATLWEGLAYLHAAGDLLSGNALGAARASGTLAVGRMLKNLRDPDFLLEQAFHGAKAFPPAPRIAPAPGPRIAGELPAAPEMMPGPPDTSGPVPQAERTQPQIQWGARMTQAAMRRLLPAPAENPASPPIGFRRGAGAAAARIIEEPPKTTPEQVSQSRSFEIERLRKVMDDPQATAEERSIAESQLRTHEELRGGRTPGEENALRGEIAKTQQQVRKWSDKMASARDYLAQKRYLENMQAAESKLARLKDAQEKGTPVKVLRGATREELTETYRNLTAEQKARAEALLEEYQSLDPIERSQFIGEHGLNRSEFKGLPFQEKIARVVTGAKRGISAADFVEAMKAAKRKLAPEGEAQ